MSASADLVIDAQGIVNRFGDTVVHDGLNLALPRGSIMALVGGSGTGKTVLVRSLILLRAPNAGTLKLFGQDALTADESQRQALRQRIGVLFQGGALPSRRR